jgi:hypothetical protein
MNRLAIWTLGLAILFVATSAGAQDRALERRQPEAHPSIEVVPAPPVYLPPVPHPPVVIHPEIIGTSLWTNRSSYWEGDDVEISFRVNRDAFVYIFSTDPAGITRMIFPNRYDMNNFARAGRTYRLPDRHYRMVATGPSGVDTLHLIATTERYDWIVRGYHEIRFDEPFPVVPRPPVEFYSDVKRSAEAQARRQPAPQGPVASPRNEGVPSERIAVVPAPPMPGPPVWIVPGYGESIHQVRVRGRHYYAPPVVVPPPPIIVPPPVPHPPIYRPPAAAAQLFLSSSPSRADVYIDGYYYGRTPLEVQLAPGTHEVTVVKSGYAPWRTMVNLKEGRRESFRFVLRKHHW